MDTLLERRKLMFSISDTEESGGTLADYVQDGLVLHMDGKYGKSGNTYWKSVVSGETKYFINCGATFNYDHIYFNGSTCLYRQQEFSVPVSAGTIEVCYERHPGSGMSTAYIATNYTNYLCFGINQSNKLYWGNGGAKLPIYLNLPTAGTVSVRTGTCIGNGVVLTSSGTDYLGGRSANTYIGYRAGTNKAYFYGKIYSIRIYNRQLTREEILANQAVDNIRFKLGLTLPTT